MIELIEKQIVNYCNLCCDNCENCQISKWQENATNYILSLIPISNNEKVAKVRIIGGDPLLHPNINQFLIDTRLLFPSAVIELVTNGTLLPWKKDQFQYICNILNIDIIIVQNVLSDKYIEELKKEYNSITINNELKCNKVIYNGQT